MNELKVTWGELITSTNLNMIYTSARIRAIHATDFGSISQSTTFVLIR